MIYSKYFERYIDVSTGYKEALLNIYEDVAKKQGFKPDYEDRKLVDFEKNPELLDTILYHVEAFGEGHPDYASVFDETEEEDEEDDLFVLFPDVCISTGNVDAAIKKFEDVVNEYPSRDNYLSYHVNKHSEGPDTYSLYYNGCQLGYGFDLDTLYEVVQCMTRKEQIDRNPEIEY